jgi:hypothetical protein
MHDTCRLPPLSLVDPSGGDMLPASRLASGSQRRTPLHPDDCRGPPTTTAAAVPAAPAAVIAASFRAIRRPSAAWWPARIASSTESASALEKADRHPAACSAAHSTAHG